MQIKKFKSQIILATITAKDDIQLEIMSKKTKLSIFQKIDIRRRLTDLNRTKIHFCLTTNMLKLRNGSIIFFISKDYIQIIQDRICTLLQCLKSQLRSDSHDTSKKKLCYILNLQNEKDIT